MLIGIKSHQVLSISVMHNIVMEYIFNRQVVSKLDQIMLEESITAWSKKVNLNASDKWELKRILNCLIADERGHFNRAKALLAKNGWHYRQLYKVGLPYIADPSKCRTFGKS